MSKVKGPLFSFESHGRIGKHLYHTKRRHQHIAAKITAPTDPKSPDQINRRSWFQECIEAWHQLSPAQVAAYNAAAKATGQVSGYIVFMAEWLVGSVPVHAPTHAPGGGDEIGIDTSQVLSGRFGMPRMPDGAAGLVLTGQGEGNDPAFAAPGAEGDFTLVGSNTVEATTTSTTPVDLLTVNGLNIAITSPILIIASGRKTTGATAYVNIGLKINTTTVFTPTTFIGIWAPSNDNAAMSGGLLVFLGPRTANYLRSGAAFYSSAYSTSDIYNTRSPCKSADMPQAVITSIILLGITNNALVTLGASDCFIYTLGT